MIQDVLQSIALERLEALRAAGVRTVLVVDASLEVCQSLRLDLDALGLRSRGATAPLNAIRCLDDEHAHIHAVIVDWALAGGGGLDLLGYLAEVQPAVRRVLMIDHRRARELEDAHQEERHHALLPKPWTLERLAAALAE